MKLKVPLLLTVLLSLAPLGAQDRGFRSAAAVGPDVVIGRQWAVFIAIDRYQEWGPLTNPVKDAREIRDILVDRFFIDEVVELYDADATAANIRRLFADLRTRTEINDSVFVFYAGHGQTDAVTSTGSWIPVDGGRDQLAQANWLPNIQIRNMLSALPAKHVFLVADACFSGDMLDTSRGASPEINNEYYRRAYSRVSRQVMTSGASETVPDTSEFALRLKSTLRRADEPCIDPEYLFSNVREVRSTQPLLGTIQGSEHQSGGSFLFFRRDDVVNPASVSAPAVSPPAAPPPAAPRPVSVPSAAAPSTPIAAPPPETPPAPSLPADLVLIQGGSFMMGSEGNEAGRARDEFRHRVVVDSFIMGTAEVSQREYQALMGANPSRVKDDALPVSMVSWFDAVEFCNRRSAQEGLQPAYAINGRTVTWDKTAGGYRLPTEAEWEYACRAGTVSLYHTGASLPPPASGKNALLPAGTPAPNDWGLSGMHGNIAEWCWDWYGDYSGRSETNPSGPASGSRRVVRGGSWDARSAALRSAARNSAAPARGTAAIGFRVCRSN
ncbi:MAG: SUMF1/EgtB/PvdO family nonheme iron enzyme [Treponema sp.]|jgi:formylglycine-generating enzyme required for sulfatase activity|nr:SUMF1/EgtB/PvdO family nonheme iron enzyme [Treponema sp.]